MKRKEAERAIRAILKAVPTRELPEARIEIDKRDGTPIAWMGGTGYNLGSAKRGGIREPDVHRSFGLDALFEREAAFRLDKRHLEEQTSSDAGSDS